jgi:hypothetical protein
MGQIVDFRVPKPSQVEGTLDEFPSLPQSTSRSIENTTTPPAQIPWPTLSGYEENKSCPLVGWVTIRVSVQQNLPQVRSGPQARWCRPPPVINITMPFYMPFYMPGMYYSHLSVPI